MTNWKIDFLDDALARAIEIDGYVIAPLLNEGEIAALREAYDKMAALEAASIGELFWPSGRCADPGVRNFAKQAIESVIPARLAEYVNVETTRFIGGTFLVKPPSEVSSLDPHQDSSHVDERHGYSVYAWIPLDDTNEENGWFQYLPGSHTWGIHQRSLNVPWPLADVNKQMWPLMHGISMKAGQVLFFHSALVHSSPPNRSGRVRLAVNYYLHPKDSPFCHFYTDGTLPEGKVEMYSVTPDFYYSENFEQKPDSAKYPLLETMDISKFDKEQVLALI